eukprot:TRINITY_DN4418_c0_g1_i6.p1 TRINITY_DN4418_c0_g1~~TRINITY_DN4418_c0_g1_i6.p1  ORF type:complete len:2010 (-),score=752.07 TRINITY_DN4418_c0_g1_i6:85-6114(-)
MKDGVPTLDFKPKIHGTYIAEIWDGDNLINTIPIEIAPKTTVGQQASVQMPANLIPSDVPLDELRAVVTDPTGKQIPALLDVDGQPKIVFTPELPGDYKAEIFNGSELLGDMPISAALQKATVGAMSNVPVPLSSIGYVDPADINCSVKDPNGQSVPAELKVIDGEPRICFIPRIPGVYEAEVLKGPEVLTSVPIEASPKVTVGENASIPVPLESLGVNDAKDVKKVVITDPVGNTKPAQIVVEDGVPRLSFVPDAVGHYVADFFGKDGEKLGDMPITSEAPKTTVGKPTALDIAPETLAGHNPDNLKLVVKDPTGEIVPSSISVKDGEPKCNFLPTVPGPYSVEVYDGPELLSEIPVEAAPKVAVSELGKPTKTKIPKKLLEGADPASLALVVKDPSGNVIPSTLDFVDGEPFLDFTPTAPGTYLGEIYAGPELVATIPIEIAAPPDQLPVPGKPLALGIPLDSFGDPEKLEIVVRDPDNKIVPSSLEIEDGKPQLKFTPKIKGAHKGEIYSGPTKIAEFPIEIGEPAEKDGIVGAPVSTGIPLDVLGVSDPSSLKLITKDPDGRVIPSKLVMKDGDVNLEFTPTKPGIYLGQIYNGDQLLVEIPIEIGEPDVTPVLDSKPEVSKPLSAKIPLADLGVDDPQNLRFVLLDPNGEETPAKLIVLEDDVKLDFTPHMPGVYLGQLWNDKDLVAEFPIKVPGPDDAVPGKPVSTGIPMEALGTDDPSKVSLVVKDPHDKEIPSKLFFKDGEAFLEFTPKTSGIHLAQFFVEDVKVVEIPIPIDDPDASVKPMLAGFPLSALGLDNSEFPKVGLVLRDPSGKEIPCELILDDGNVMIKFIPTFNGTYKGEISVDGTKIAEIPIEVNRPDLKEPSPEDMLQPEKEGEPQQQNVTGKPATTGIPLEALGTDDPSQVSVIVKNPEGKEKESKLFFKDGEVFLEFTPDIPGLYKAEFLLNNKKVAEIPIQIDDPKPVKPMQAGFPMDALGLDPSEIGRVGLRLLDPAGKQIPSKLSYLDPNITIEFTPTFNGTYLGEISVDESPVAEIPIEVNRPDLNAPTAEDLVKKPDGEAPSSKPMVAGFPLSALGDPDPADVSFNLKDPTGKSIPFELSFKDDNVTVKFKPTFNGVYIGEIFVNKNKVAEVPIEVKRDDLREPTPEELAEGVKQVAEEKKSAPPAPMAAGFPLSALGIDDPSRLKIKLLDPSKKEIPVTVKCDDENVTLEFTPTYAGTYMGEIYVDDKKVAEIPIEVNRPELPTAPPETEAEKETKKTTAPTPMQAQFPLSALGVEDASLLDIKVKDPAGEITPSSFFEKDGNISLEFTPKYAGTYMGEVYISGKKVAEIPIEVNRPDLEPAPAKKEVEHGKALRSVIPLDQIGVEDAALLEIKLKDPTKKEIPVKVEFDKENVSLEFVPKMKGTHMGEIYMKGTRKLLAQVPIEVNWDELPSPSTKDIAQAIIPKSEGPKQTVALSLSAYGIKDPATLSIKLKDPNGEDHPSEIIIEGDDVYLIFIARISGLYHAYLYINVVELIAVVPIEVVLPEIETRIISIPSHVERYLIPISIAAGIDWRLIIIRVTTLTLIVVKVTVKIIFEGGVYKVELIPPDVGEYLLHLEYPEGVPLPGTPFKFEVVLSPQVLPIGSEQTVKVGESATVPFKAINVSASKIEVSMKVPSGEDLPVFVSVISDDRFNITFTTKVSGVHDVTFSVAGVPIGLCPLEIGITTTTTVTETTTTITDTHMETTQVEQVFNDADMKALGDKIQALLNALGSYKPTAELNVNDFKTTLTTQIQQLLSLIENQDWAVILKKPTAELNTYLMKVLEYHRDIIVLLIKNLCLVTNEQVKGQIITVLQQNIPKIMPAYIQNFTTVMKLDSNRELAAPNFVKLAAAFTQIWSNTLQTFKQFKGGFPPDPLTKIPTDKDPNTILNAFISFLNSPAATSSDPSLLTLHLTPATTPTTYAAATAHWPTIVRSLVTAIKNPSFDPSDVLYQSARIILYYRRLILEAFQRDIKDWNQPTL